MSITYEQLMDAARKADAAGDTSGAKRLLEMALEARKPDPQAAMRDRIAQAKAGTLQMQPGSAERAAQSDQIAQDQATISSVPTALAGLTKFNQGIPFIGEYTDELTGMIDPKAGQLQRDVQDAMGRQYPKTSLGLQIGGGIVGSAAALGLGGGAKAADFVSRGATMATRAVRGAAVAAPVGALEGAAAYSGAAKPGERLQAAGRGAMVGGALSAALGAFAPALGQGVTELAKRIKKLDVSTIAREFGLSEPAARVVRSQLLADDLDAAAAALARGGDDAMLANSGPATRQALDTAASSGGRALTIARERVGGAVNDASKRFLGVIDDVLGTADGGLKAASKAISSRTAGIRAQAYDRAYRTPINYADDTGRNIEAVLQRIPPRTVQDAVNEANDAMRHAGTTNKQIIAEVADDGSVTFRNPLNVQQLDELKKALQSIAVKETDDETGKISTAGMRASSLARDISAALADAVPSYKVAVKLGGDKIAEDNALKLGRKLLTARTSVEDVRNFVKGGLSDEAGAALRKGVRENLDAIMGNARTTIADLESGAMDFATGQNAAAEAVAAVRNILTRNNMMKSRYAIGSDAKRLFDELEKMADVLVLRAAVARGSATAIRRAGQQQMADEVAPGIARRIAGNLGNPLDAAREVTRGVVGIDARTISEQQMAYFAEIADALTRIRGPEAQRALVAVKNAMAGQPMKDADAALIGRALSGSAAIGAYQTGSQSLTPQ